MVYKWKEGSHYSPEQFNPQVIGEHLDGLRAKRGTLTPSHVVEDARKKVSPTHKLFTWEDAEAAKQFRLSQARQLLRSITVVVNVQRDGQESELTSRAFVVVTKAEGRTYEPVLSVLKDDDQRTQLLRQAGHELTAFRKKYQQLDELSSVFAAIDVALPLLDSAASDRPAA